MLRARPRPIISHGSRRSTFIPRNRSPALTILSRAFLGPLFWTPSRKRDRSRSPAICPSRHSAAYSPAATRTLPTCIPRCWGPRRSCRALRSRGGVGKTRLAIEYAWSREADYSALLFVNASDDSALNAGLAGLTAFEILDLPEKEARDDATKITAVLRWLESNPNWLMILDNVDDRAALAEVAKLMPRLKGGHVVITARASNFPAGVRKLEVSTLDESAAAQFLLDRSEADRSKSKDDAALARTLARELGGLALGLEQAGAHIATDRIGIARYLKLWSESRDRLLGWTDEALTGSERNLARTWATSVAKLKPESRRLLERLAF